MGDSTSTTLWGRHLVIVVSLPTTNINHAERGNPIVAKHSHGVAGARDPLVAKAMTRSLTRSASPSVAKLLRVVEPQASTSDSNSFQGKRDRAHGGPETGRTPRKRRTAPTCSQEGAARPPSGNGRRSGPSATRLDSSSTSPASGGATLRSSSLAPQ